MGRGGNHHVVDYAVVVVIPFLRSEDPPFGRTTKTVYSMLHPEFTKDLIGALGWEGRFVSEKS